MTTSRVPADFHTITPHLVVRGVADAITWYVRAFGAHELLRTPAPDGEHIMHSELLLGDSRFFVVDEFPHMQVSPTSLGGSSQRTRANRIYLIHGSKRIHSKKRDLVYCKRVLHCSG